MGYKSSGNRKTFVIRHQQQQGIPEFSLGVLSTEIKGSLPGTFHLIVRILSICPFPTWLEPKIKNPKIDL